MQNKSNRPSFNELYNQAYAKLQAQQTNSVKVASDVLPDEYQNTFNPTYEPVWDTRGLVGKTLDFGNTVQGGAKDAVYGAVGAGQKFIGSGLTVAGAMVDDIEDIYHNGYSPNKTYHTAGELAYQGAGAIDVLTGAGATVGNWISAGIGSDTRFKGTNFQDQIRDAHLENHGANAQILADATNTAIQNTVTHSLQGKESNHNDYSDAYKRKLQNFENEYETLKTNDEAQNFLTRLKLGLKYGEVGINMAGSSLPSLVFGGYLTKTVGAGKALHATGLLEAGSTFTNTLGEMQQAGLDITDPNNQEKALQAAASSYAITVGGGTVANKVGASDLDLLNRNVTKGTPNTVSTYLKGLGIESLEEGLISGTQTAHTNEALGKPILTNMGKNTADAVIGTAYVKALTQPVQTAKTVTDIGLQGAKTVGDVLGVTYDVGKGLFGKNKETNPDEIDMDTLMDKDDDNYNPSMALDRTINSLKTEQKAKKQKQFRDQIEIIYGQVTQDLIDVRTKLKNSEDPDERKELEEESKRLAEHFKKAHTTYTAFKKEQEQEKQATQNQQNQIADEIATTQEQLSNTDDPQLQRELNARLQQLQQQADTLSIESGNLNNSEENLNNQSNLSNKVKTVSDFINRYTKPTTAPNLSVTGFGNVQQLPKNNDVGSNPTQKDFKVTPHNIPNQRVRSPRDIAHLGFKTPFVNVSKKGNSLFNGSEVKGDTLAFMKVLDDDKELQSIMNAFTSITGGNHANGTHSHGKGFKIDVDLKNGDNIDTYKKAVQRVRQLANQHGYDVEVWAEKHGWHNVGDGFRHIKGAGSHLDIKVKGRKTGTYSPANQSTQTVQVGSYKVIQTGSNKTNVIQNADGSVVKRVGGTRAWRNNNAGNIEFGEFAKSHGAIGSDSRFAIFPTKEMGDKAKESLLFNSKNYKNLTLSQAINRYAPPSENNTKWYINTVLQAVGGQNKVMSQYTPQERKAILQAFEKVEGYKAGTETLLQSATNAGTFTQGQVGNHTGTTQTTNKTAINTQLNLNFGTTETDNSIKPKQETDQEVITQPEQGKPQAQVQNNPEVKITEQSTSPETENSVKQIVKLFSRAEKLDENELQQAIATITRFKDAGMLSESKANALYKLADFKVQQLQGNLSKVQNDLWNGVAGDTPQNSMTGIHTYAKIFGDYINGTEKLSTVQKSYENFDRLVSNQVSKARAIDEALAYGASSRNPFTLAKMADNQEWEITNLSPQEVKAQGGSTFTVTTDNRGTREIRESANYLNEMRENWSAILGDSLKATGNPNLDGLTNKQGTHNAKQQTQTVKEVKPTQSVSAPKPVQEKIVKPIKQSTQSTDVSDKPIVNDDGLKRVTKLADVNKLDFDKQVFMGRGNPKNDKGQVVTVSMGNVGTSADTKIPNRIEAGSVGYLANPYQLGNSSKGSWFKDTPQERMSNYVSLFKKLANKNDDFVKSLVRDKNKERYYPPIKNQDKDTENFLEQMFKELPNDVEQAREYIAGIDDYNVDSQEIEHNMSIGSLASNQDNSDDTDDNQMVKSSVNKFENTKQDDDKTKVENEKAESKSDTSNKVSNDVEISDDIFAKMDTMAKDFKGKDIPNPVDIDTTSLYQNDITNDNTSNVETVQVGNDELQLVDTTQLDMQIDEDSETNENANDVMSAERLGKLSVFANQNKEAREAELAKPLSKQNIVFASFTQGSKRNLNFYPNLSNRLRKNIDSTNIDKAKKEQLKHYLEFEEIFASSLVENFQDNGTLFKYEDLKQYFNTGTKDNPKFDNNLLSAITLSAYDYVIANGSSLYNTEKELKVLMNLDDEDNVPSLVYQEYGKRGMPIYFLAHRLGRQITKNLELSQFDDVPANNKARLEASLGHWLLHTMVSTGLMYVSEVPTKDYYDAITNAGGKAPMDSGKVKDDARIKFIGFANYKATKPEVHSEIEKVIALNKAGNGFVQKIYSLSSSVRKPLTQKPKFVNNKIAKSRSKISKEQLTQIKQMQNAPMVLNQDMFKIIDGIGYTDMLDMIGGTEPSEEQLNKLHISKQKSAIAKAQGIRREFDNALQWFNEIGNNEFYDTIDTKVNTRMHYSSNLFNMQSSTLHRALGGYTNLNQEIDTSNFDGKSWYDKDGKPLQTTMFLRAIFENAEGTKDYINEKLKNTKYKGMGTVDKLPSKVFMPHAWEYLNTEKVQKAIIAMTNAMDGNITDKDRKAIKTIVDEWDMGMQSLHALHEVTKFFNAYNDGKKFTAFIGLGSDGVNNGTAISVPLYGSYTFKQLQQLGFYTYESDARNYFDTRGDVDDYYEALAPEIEKHLKVKLDELNQEVSEYSNIPAIVEKVDKNREVFNVFFHTTKGINRKSLKAMLVPFTYSAGLNSIEKASFNHWIDGIYNIFENKDKNPKDFEAVNDLLISLLYKSFTDENVLEYEFTKYELETLNKAYHWTVGEIIQSAMTDYASDLIQARKLHTTAHSTATQVYVTAYNAYMQDLVKQVREEHRPAVEKALADRNFKTEELRQDAIEAELNFLTPTQKQIKEQVEDKLEKVLPVLATTHSNNQRNDYAVEMLDRDRKLVNDGSVSVKGTTKKEHQVTTVDGDKISMGGKLPYSTFTPIDAGLRPSSQQVQSIDAKVAMYASAVTGTVSLNIHDSTHINLKDQQKVIQEQNKQFFLATLNTHTNYNTASSLISSLQGIGSLDNGIVNKDELLRDFWFGLTPITYKYDADLDAKGLLKAYIKEMQSRDLKKIALYNDVDNIHQYSGEGGEYILTDKDRESIKQAHQDIQKLYQELNAIVDDMSNADIVIKSPQVTAQNIPNKLNEINAYSGGQVGGDIIWDDLLVEQGASQGRVQHFALPQEQIPKKWKNKQVYQVSKEELATAKTEASKLGVELNNDLHARNYYQIKDSDAVFAVTQVTDGQVIGGTGKAIQLAIKMNKPIYVLDTNTVSWHTYENGRLVEIKRPKLTKNPALIGLRKLTNKDTAYKTYDKSMTTIRTPAVDNYLSTINEMRNTIRHTINKVSVPDDKIINIWSSDKNGFEMLSNLAPRPFTYDGVNYKSVEHAYQSLKSGKFDKQTYQNKEWSTPFGIVKSDLDTIVDKYELMRALMRESFKQNPQALALLQKTNGNQLTHSQYNQQSDDWTAMFPKLLIQLRHEFGFNGQVQNGNTKDDSKPATSNKQVSLQKLKESIAKLELSDDIPQKRLFDTLLSLKENSLNNFKFEFVNEPDNDKGWIENDVITINNAQFENSTQGKINKLSTVNHEMIHAITRDAIFNKQDTKAVQDLRKIYLYLKDKYNNKPDSSVLENIFGKQVDETVGMAELASYGLENADVAKYIQDNLNMKQAGIEPKKQGVFKQFLTLMASILGVNGKKYQTFVKTVEEIIAINDDNPDPTDPNKPTGKLSQKSDTKPLPKLFSKQVQDEIKNEVDSIPIHLLIKDLDKGNINDDFNNHLDSINDTLIEKFYTFTNKGLVNPKNGTLKGTLKVSGYQSSQKERYTYQALYEVLDLFMKDNAGKLPVNQMDKLFKSAQEQYKHPRDLFKDFDNKDKDEQKQLTKMFNFVFKQRTDGLNPTARFMAMALSNQQFADILSTTQTKKKYSDSTWFNKVMSVLEKVWDTVLGNIYNRNSKSDLESIVKYTQVLSKLESQVRNGQANRIQLMYDRTYNAIGAVGSVPIKGVIKANTLIAKSNVPILSNVSSALRNFANTGNEHLLNFVDDLNNFSGNQLHNHAQELLNELTHHQDSGKWIDKLTRATQAIGKVRASVTATTKATLLNQFNTISDDEKTTLTYGLLKTDLGILIENGYTPKQVLSMFNDQKRKTEIEKLQQELKKLIPNDRQYNDMRHQIHNLGYYLATSISAKHLHKNSEMIARSFGSKWETDDIDENVYRIVDTLVSLNALHFTNKNKLTGLDRLLKEEEKGLIAVLNQSRSLALKSKQEFDGNPLNYQKGYLPQILNPYANVVWATKDEIENYKAKGYEIVEELAQDVLDQTEKRFLMYHPEHSPNNFVSGALDMKDSHAKGTVIYDRIENSKDVIRIATELSKARQLRSVTLPKLGKPPKGSHAMIATYATDGSIQDFKYEMQDSTRENLLERNMDGIELLGTLAGNLEFRPLIRKQQVEVAKVMVQDAQANIDANPKAFVHLDFESDDPRIVQMTRLIPYETHRKLRETYGNKPIPVRASTFNALFGFKAYSIVNAFEKMDNGQKLNFAENLIYSVMNGMFKEKGRSYSLQVEKFVMGLMSQIKDMIVVRSGGVLLGNILSNIQLLLVSGVNPVEVMSGTLFAWRNGKAYSKLQTRMYEIDSEIRMTRNKSELVRLKAEKATIIEQLNRNPMQAYMQAGLQSTIVEDLSQKGDKIFKSQLEKKMDKLTANIPQTFKDIFEVVTIGEGTQLHNFLSEATQFSDFAAKYVLANHIYQKGLRTNPKMTDAQKQELFEQGIWEAQKSFINYDVPTSVGLDYMNRMGLVLFTKFFLRFQSRLIKLFKEKPAQTIAIHYLFNAMGQQGIVEPFILNRLGNPLDGSLLLADDAFGSILTFSIL